MEKNATKGNDQVLITETGKRGELLPENKRALEGLNDTTRHIKPNL